MTEIKEFFWVTQGDKILSLTIVFPSGKMRSYTIQDKKKGKGD